MASASPSLIPSRPTEADYMALDRTSDTRYECLDGQIAGTPGGTLRHVYISGSCQSVLRSLLSGRGRVFGEGARIRTPTTGSHLDADTTVVLGPVQTHNGSSDILTNASLIVEVLSSSTRNPDFIEKFRCYRELESFKDYLLVETGSAIIGHFSLQADKSWRFMELSGTEAVIQIPTLELTIPLASIYQDAFDVPNEKSDIQIQ